MRMPISPSWTEEEKRIMKDLEPEHKLLSLEQVEALKDNSKEEAYNIKAQSFLEKILSLQTGEKKKVLNALAFVKGGKLVTKI